MTTSTMSAPIRAISLHQPWATAIALGLKEHETRGWGTPYRGPLAICSALEWGRGTRDTARRIAELLERPELVDPPRGFVVALVELADSVRMTDELVLRQTQVELALGGWAPGRFAWRLANVRPLAEPVPIKGRQRMWTLSLSEAAKVRERVA